MRAKRLLAITALTGLITVSVIIVGMTSSEFVTSACACGTVNDVVISDLNQLDGLVRQYAVEHNGLLPTYAELTALTEGNAWIRAHLTSQVDLITGMFTFRPTPKDVYTLGYAVSVNRDRYILLGIGLNEKYKDTYLFGRRINREIIGYSLPILRPGDIPPTPSPLSWANGHAGVRATLTVTDMSQAVISTVLVNNTSSAELGPTITR